MKLPNTDTRKFSIQDETIQFNEHRLATRWIIPRGLHAPDHPALVFLHEGLGCMQLWGDFPQLIATTCGLPAFMYDRLGHGLSDALDSAAVDIDYLAREASVLPHVLSACDIRRAVLIGHSDGGTIALLYAATVDSGILGVVTEAAHVYVDDTTRRGIRHAVAAYHDQDLKSRLAKYHGPKTELIFRRWADTWLSDGFAPWDIRSCLKQVRCPVLAIQGDGDEYGAADQMFAIAAHAGGRSETFLVPGCRHVPHRQARQAVAARMIAFVQSLQTTSAGPK